MKITLIFSTIATCFCSFTSMTVITSYILCSLCANHVHKVKVIVVGVLNKITALKRRGSQWGKKVGFNILWGSSFNQCIAMMTISRLFYLPAKMQDVKIYKQLNHFDRHEYNGSTPGSICVFETLKHEPQRWRCLSLYQRDKTLANSSIKLDSNKLESV